VLKNALLGITYDDPRNCDIDMAELAVVCAAKNLTKLLFMPILVVDVFNNSTSAWDNDMDPELGNVIIRAK
jgi:hypothetical protein